MGNQTRNCELSGALTAEDVSKRHSTLKSNEVETVTKTFTTASAK